MSEPKRSTRRTAGKNTNLVPNILWPSTRDNNNSAGTDSNHTDQKETEQEAQKCIEQDKELDKINKTLNEQGSNKGIEEKSVLEINFHGFNLNNGSKADRSSKLKKCSKLLEKKKKELEIERVKLKILELESQIDEAKSISSLQSFEDGNNVMLEQDNKEKYTRTKEWVEEIPNHFSEKLSVSDKQEIVGDTNESIADNITKICNVFVDTMKSMSKVQLQPINISDGKKENVYFDGKAQDWPLFIEHFKRQVLKYKLDDEEKIFKLQRCLKGEALEAVRSMMLHPKNTDQIIKTLELKFGRNEQIIESLLYEIKTIPKIKEGDMESIIKLSCKCNNFVATLEHLNSKSYLENPQLIKELIIKLPDSCKLSWGQEVARLEGKSSLDSFSKWLNDLANAAVYVSSRTPTTSIEHLGNKNFKSNFQKRNEAVLTSQQNKKEYCIYCKNEGHKIPQCPKIREDTVEERISKLTKFGTCFRCLNGRHLLKECKSRRICEINDCGKRHHELIHRDQTSNEEKNCFPIGQIESSLENREQIGENIMWLEKNHETDILLRIAPVKLYGPNGSIKIYALFDEGSTTTLLEEDVAKQLGLQKTPDPFCMHWAKNIVTYNDTSCKVNLEISGIHENAKVFKMKNVRTITDLSLPTQTMNISNYNKFPHLQGLPLEDIGKEQAKLLIGQDNINLTVARKVYQGPENSPMATKTNLDWVVHGRVEKRLKNYNFFSCATCVDEYAELNKLIKENFSVESFGTNIQYKSNNIEEKKAIEILNKTTKKIEGENRYETGLLWKEENISLPESKTNAFHRLLCVERKMLKSKEYASVYKNKIIEYEEKGYVRKLSPEEATNTSKRTWYLPHFGVINPKKPKLRFVFDAAAKSNGISLNDNLLQGPDFLTSLPGVLMRFRRRKWAFCGDIREMFHQVRIIKEDQSSQRFLWRDGDLRKPIDTYEMVAMTFGATCSPCSAQYVKNLCGKNTKIYPEVRKDIEQNFYVDDYLDSTNYENEAIEKIKKIIKVCLEGGFQVVNWVSNSAEVNKTFSGEKLMKEINMSTCDRILGIWWDTRSDKFIFKTKFANVPEKILLGDVPTKKQVLKIIMSPFDPLGLITFLTIRGRIIMQQIWRSGIDWDSKIPNTIYEIWQKWLEMLKTLEEIKIPRCYTKFLKIDDQVEVHIFCDASEEAFAAIAYLQIKNDNICETSLLIARAKVSPLKPLSIPRLELQAAVLGSRLATTIQQEIDINISKFTFWSDSTTVLSWIRGDGRNYKQFVANRVGEIQENTKNASWRYIPTNLNVADLATRLNFNEKDNTNFCRLWFTGPDILKNSNETTTDWLRDKELPSYNFDKDTERKVVCFLNSRNTSTCSTPDVSRFSKWRRLVRTTAYFQRFCKKILFKIGRCQDGGLWTGIDLTVEELQNAERKIIRRAQEESFLREIKLLQKGMKIEKSSKIFKLNPYLDENKLLRLSGRLSNATYLPEDVRNPYILDNKNLHTSLLIKYYHEMFGHQGIETVLNEIRQKFWIIKGRAAVKKVFSSCLFCRKRKASPEIPLMGDLPEERLQPGEPPFTYTGVDYFGALNVTVGRHKEKRYGVLFTCLTTRAIHLEVAHNLTSDSAIMAILRFSNRRGVPKVIYSDNGTNFKGADEEIRKCLKEFDQNKIEPKLEELGITWKFIPPGAPHMGGCWERLIGSVKKILGNILKEEAPRDETLLTMFSEVENIVNSRPLTHVSSDPHDLISITPNHFLKGKYSPPLVPGKFDTQEYKKQWKKSQRLADIFWTRWVKEYLPTLTKRSKWNNDSKPLEEGDVVILIEPNAPRSHWPLGVIQKLLAGKDGRVRVVDIKTKDSTFRRPVTKICKFSEN